MPIFMALIRPKVILEKHLLQPNRKKKIQLISKCGIQLIAENPIILSSIMITQRTYHRFGERSLKNLQTDYLDVFFITQTQSFNAIR
jgi:predicted oxidoreductase